jgi:hypothetical protein
VTIYLVRRQGPTLPGQYDEAVVLARNPHEAARTHPSGHCPAEADWLRTWVRPSMVLVTRLGNASLPALRVARGSVICASVKEQSWSRPG